MVYGLGHQFDSVVGDGGEEVLGGVPEVMQDMELDCSAVASQDLGVHEGLVLGA